MKEKLVVYQTENGSIALQGDVSDDTIWATQKQISELFDVDVRTINEHLQNIYSTQELDELPTIRKFRIVQLEGSRQVEREVQHYNLDAILSVGYRVNSKTATKFRKWATTTLREHITQGYTINPARIEQNYEQFLKAVEDVKKMLPATSGLSSNDVLDLITLFAGTWFSLDAYDKASLPQEGLSRKEVEFTAEGLGNALSDLKMDLIDKKEATELFAQEKQSGNLSGIVGNVMQSVFGEDAYPSIEEKAAHLLYFIIKNHPFNDGNKRSGAFAFVWFLRRAGVDFSQKITPEALTVLALLIAESSPKDRDRMVGLVILLLNGRGYNV
ncbi:MAG: virulence protein RhuM/Fic/DOC family protein [Candidatus Gracilibacteria bacterium]|nr:virulence protein RhuM/Fic/DOC family protein [Candidatus Gracilibacteria bacterium]